VQALPWHHAGWLVNVAFEFDAAHGAARVPAELGAATSKGCVHFADWQACGDDGHGHAPQLHGCAAAREKDWVRSQGACPPGVNATARPRVRMLGRTKVPGFSKSSRYLSLMRERTFLPCARAAGAI